MCVIPPTTTPSVDRATSAEQGGRTAVAPPFAFNRHPTGDLNQRRQRPDVCRRLQKRSMEKPTSAAVCWPDPAW
jgi:hypothetical protein